MIIAGGGTGGHLFPGIAIAEAFLKREATNEVLFVVTGKPLEKKVLGAYGYPYRLLDVEGIKGRSLRKSLLAVMKVPLSIWQAIVILRDYRPEIVLGVGGYVAGPVVLAAFILRLPTAIAEQNVLPGVTNKMLSYLVDRIFLSFPDRWGAFPKVKVMVTGNPVRSVFIETGKEKRREEKEKFNVFIFGGSQGSRIINRMMVEALPFLTDLKDQLFFLHQTGEADFDFVADGYRKLGFMADIRPFVFDMADAYGKSDLVICRAGATTVAEITTIGKGAILIPFAQAVNDHQAVNARFLVEAGAAEMIIERDLTPEILASSIRRFYHDRNALDGMAGRAKALGNPRAAEKIVDALYELVGKREK